MDTFETLTSPDNLQTLTEQLNTIYSRLETKAWQLIDGLKNRIFDTKLAYYSGHRFHDKSGKCFENSFPIPVIECAGLCEIEINLDRITVTTKLNRQNALAETYDKFLEYDFEVYGIDDSFNILYRKGMSIEQLKDNISKSNEKGVFLSFQLSFDTDGNTLYEFAKLLRREGFSQ